MKRVLFSLNQLAKAKLTSCNLTYEYNYKKTG